MIDIYVNEIRQALRHQRYFPALALALALPDICGMAEFPGLNVRDRYTAWYDKYLGEVSKSGGFDDTPYLSGEVVYSLRCTFLHQGSPNVQTGKIREAANQVDKFTKDGPENKKPQGTAQTGKKERKIRGFFEENFKEKKYQEKKKEIIQAVLTAPSKQQLNNVLTKLFPGEDVKVILKRFKEQIKDLPGK